MQTTTITSKSGKTYEVTYEITAGKTHGTYVTDADGKLIRGEDGNWLKQGVEDQMVASAKIDGKRLGHYTAPTQPEVEKKIVVAAKRYAEVAEADAVWYPRCKVVAANYRGDDPVGTSASDFHVGQVVAVYGHGGMRTGLVEKVGKKNVGVIYVVASSGALWRKSMAFDKVRIIEAGAQTADEVADETVTVELSCGHQSERIHQASSVFDFPAEGTYCPTCGATKPLAGYDAPEADGPCDCSCHTVGDAGMLGCCSDSAYVSDGELGDISAQALAASTTDEEWADETERRLAGLKAERSSLRARIPAGTDLRPELQTRLVAVEAEIAALSLDCTPTGQRLGDGRDRLSCGSVANPAGYCCDHGGFVRDQPQSSGAFEAAERRLGR